jgi:pyruvate,water dikinase
LWHVVVSTFASDAPPVPITVAKEHTLTGKRTFPDPYAVETPEGAEGWQDLYAYHNLFQEGRQAVDGKKTWFRNSLHFPEVSYPFDQITIDCAFMGTGVTNTRVFAMPPAKGLDVRVVNGYTYMSALPAPAPEEIERRAAEFGVRAGHYFQNWDNLYEDWVERVKGRISAVKGIAIPEMTEFETLEYVTKTHGNTQANTVLANYLDLIAQGDAIWTLHSEFLNLGYAAYLQFLLLCKANFPDITDQTISRMVSGIDVILFRPDDELRRLAKLAEELGVGDAVLASKDETTLEANLSGTDAGKKWLADLEETKNPWFYFSNGSGMYHHHRSWVDDLSMPIQGIGDYIKMVRRGESLERQLDKRQAERDEITNIYRDLLEGDVLAEFDGALGLSRTVFPYVENHNFYIEHWFMTEFWNKVREFGALLAKWGFWESEDDIFMLRRAEVVEAVIDLQAAWSHGTEPQGPAYWPAVVAKRKAIYKTLAKWTPPPALGPVPEDVSEPLTIMLWGITPETVERWLDQAEGVGSKTELGGFAAAPGIAEGRARIVLTPDELDQVQDGEILVAPVTNTSWTPVFSRIKAAVSDIGGIMCHAAIVSREYGLPAVVGTGFGTTTIKTGMLIRVDGDTGKVTILEDA